MKLLYLIHGLQNAGGMESVILRKANWLAENTGHEVSILVCGPKGRNSFFPVSPKVRIYDLGVNSYNGFHAFAARRHMSRFLEEHRPDICISTGRREIFFLSRIDDGSRKICEFHFSYNWLGLKYKGRFLGRIRHRRYTRRFVKALEKMDGFVVLTHEDRAAWGRIGLQPWQVYNPCPEPAENPAPLDAKRFIAIGRLSSEKNYPDMIRVWAEVHRRHPDWGLDIFGGGKQRDRIERAVSEAGLDGSVRLMGTTKDVEGELLSHSGLIMTSHCEGFPMVLLEAAACGVPAVSYSCQSGPSEIIEDGRSGFLVGQGDVSAMADRICRLIEDAELRKAMGRRSREISGRFRIESIMQEWLRLFESLPPRG